MYIFTVTQCAKCYLMHFIAMLHLITFLYYQFTTLNMNKHSHWLPVARKKEPTHPPQRPDLAHPPAHHLCFPSCHDDGIYGHSCTALHFIVPLSKCVVCCFLDWGLVQLEDVLQWYLFPLVDQWLVVIFDSCSNGITSGGSESYCHVDNVIFLLTYS